MRKIQSLNQEKKKEVFLMPLFSFFLPGFDQYVADQSNYGLTYTSIALLGLSIRENNFNKRFDSSKKDQTNEFRYGLGTFGGKLFETSGSLSAYHSFRTRARTRDDDFSFLKRKDSLKEILLAPFNFNYLKK